MTRLVPWLAAALLAAGGALAADLPPPLVSAVPVTASQVAAAVAKIDSLVADVMQRTGVPGMAVAVVVDGKVALAKGYGVRLAGHPDPVDADTVFQLASVSKSLSSTLVARLVGEGRLGWDTPMRELMPGFALSGAEATALVTVGDLFSHRSGLPGHAGDALEDIGFDRAAVIERLHLLPLDGFRDHYAYTNFGLTAAAQAVADREGTAWEELIRSELYAPLGMERTSSRFDDFMARENRAVPHMREGDGWVAKEQRDPDAQSPAGGASSSVNDMAKWLAMLLADGSAAGTKLIESDALIAAVTPQAVSSPPIAFAARPGFYGFGIGVSISPTGRMGFSHSGAFNLGAATTYYAIPSLGVGIVVLPNAQPVGAAETVSLGFVDLVERGELTRDWFVALAPLFAPLAEPIGGLAGQTPPSDPAPAGALDRYAGNYRNDYFGPAEVEATGDGLVLKVGPQGMSFPLRHWSGPDFAFVPRGETAPAGSLAQARFDLGAGTLTVDIWDENGLGTFRR